MAKQPYIPFYLGDYIQDTRMLPLNVRGGWLEIILQCWKSGGEISGTHDDFARLMSCTKDEAVLVIQDLNQKKICDYVEMENGVIKIGSRKIKKMLALTETRKNAGLKGGNPVLVKQKSKRVKAKFKQIPEYDNESKDIKIVFPFNTETFIKEWNKWIAYKLEQFNFTYKPIGLQTTLNELAKLAGYSEKKAIELINYAISHSWQGFYEMKPTKTDSPKSIGEAKTHN